MANLVAAGMKSLGEFLGHQNMDSKRIEEAFTLVEHMRIASIVSSPKVLTTPDSAPDNVAV